MEEILPVLEEPEIGAVVQTAEEICSFGASFSGVSPEGFPAFADSVEGEGEQVHDGKGLGRVFLFVSKIMGEVAAVIFKHLEGFVLDLPARPSAGGDLLHVVAGNLQAGSEGSFVGGLPVVIDEGDR